MYNIKEMYNNSPGRMMRRLLLKISQSHSTVHQQHSSGSGREHQVPGSAHLNLDNTHHISGLKKKKKAQPRLNFLCRMRRSHLPLPILTTSEEPSRQEVAQCEENSQVEQQLHSPGHKTVEHPIKPL